MRVAPNIYLVASGVQGCLLTDDLDCNCWLFDAGSDLVLFDTGAGASVNRLLDILRENGLVVERLNHVFLTHAHADHSGGAAEIKHRLGATISCGWLTTELLAKGEDAFSLTAARKAGGYPDDYRYHRPVPDFTLKPGAPVAIGNLTITSVATPGHSLDHTCFLVEQQGSTALVSGDAILHSGRIIYQGTYDFDVRQSAESIRILASLDFDLLLPGHGIFARNGGRRHVDAAIARIDALKTPRAVAFVPI